MEFNEVMNIISSKWAGLDVSKYDGIIVKKLESSNTLDEGRTTNQTHIAITGDQMDIFPFIYSERYMGETYENRDESMKRFFVISAPARLYQNNVRDWANDAELNDMGLSDNEMVDTHFCVFRIRRRGQTDQIQLSLINSDGSEFIAFRKSLHVGDYLIILKRKNLFAYDCIGVKANNSEGLRVINNKFFNISTNTLISLDDIDLDNRSEEEEQNVGTNILFYGVPGCGKSFAVNNICTNPDVMERVVFHPDYTYSDFVGQILPRVDEYGELEYQFTPGPFTSILKKAEDQPEVMFYLVIEEINRGNAPAIFGEIFQLLDRDVDGKSEYSITNYDIAKAVYGDENTKVFIPSNLTILATMNTSDQNVFTLDTAFQRRWEMKLIPNRFDDNHASDMIEGSEISWGAFATTVNDIVLERYAEFGGSGDKRLGAYFARLSELRKEALPEKVLKYLWDDAFRMNEQDLFAEEMKSLDDVVETYKTTMSDPLKAVLNLAIYSRMMNKMDVQNEGSDEANQQEIETETQE